MASNEVMRAAFVPCLHFGELINGRIATYGKSVVSKSECLVRPSRSEASKSECLVRPSKSDASKSECLVSPSKLEASKSGQMADPEFRSVHLSAFCCLRICRRACASAGASARRHTALAS